MKRLVFLLLLAPSVLRASPIADPLWQKAVEAIGRVKTWVPGLTVMNLEVADDKGKTTDAFEYWYRLSPDDHGAPVLSLQKALRNGVDVTASEIQAQQRRSGINVISLLMANNPFDPDRQNSVQETTRVGTLEVDRQSCAEYSFVMKAERAAPWRARQRWSLSNGLPLEISYSPKPLPFGVQKMITTLSYAHGYLKEVVMDGSGGFLFLKRVFHTRVTLDDYWKTKGGS